MFRVPYHNCKDQGFDCVVAMVDMFHVLSFYFYKIDINIVASSSKKKNWLFFDLLILMMKV
jgi:hypothetical protein